MTVSAPSSWPSSLHWTALLALSAAFVVALEALRLPAALLLGPMMAAILLSAAELGIKVPEALFVAAQGMVGCMIAGNLPLELGGAFLRDWPIFLAGTLSVVGAAGVLGYLLTVWQVLPGTTAVWGSAPGAATAMTLMAEASAKADMRLVAFMQYLRVVCCAVVASLVSRLWVTVPAGAPSAVPWFPPLDPLVLATSVAVAVGGAYGGRRLRVPGGPLLLPLAIGLALKTGGVTVALPPWLLALAYAVVGWSIGLRFTRPILAHAWRALPRVLGSILALIAVCGGFAAILVALAGTDPLTAYLATSPGGADSVAIIAASSHVDLPFVMAMQITRFLVVLFAGPVMARWIAARVPG